MPSGAKKRKAAKRKKEQEHQQQQQQQLGEHPTSPTTGLPHHPQGNGEKEEEDDLICQEGKESESGSDVASPTARGSSRCQHIEVEADEDWDKSRIEAEVEEKGKKDSNTTGSVVTVSVMESTENGGSEQPSESLVPQQTEDEATEKGEAEVPVSVIEVQKDEILPPPPSDSIPPSADVPISKIEEESSEHIQSEKGEEVASLGDTSPLIECKQSDVIDTASPVELSVPISEGVVQASDVRVEGLEVVESLAEAQSHRKEEKAVLLTSAACEQPDPSVESHPHTETREIAGTTEVVQSTQLGQRTSWMSCCGLFDVITGGNR